MVHGVEFLQRLFDIAVVAEGAVENAAAGCPCAKFVKRLLAGFDHVRVERHAHIVIGAKQDGLTAIADGDGWRLYLVHHEREGISHAGGEQIFTLLDQRIKFRKKISHFFILPVASCRLGPRHLANPDARSGWHDPEKTRRGDGN